MSFNAFFFRFSLYLVMIWTFGVLDSEENKNAFG